MNAQDRRLVQRAIQRYRLCAGVEFALVKVGYAATVDDALQAVRMSRRSFYEHFTSLRDAILRMQRAVEPTMARLMEQRGITEKEAFSVLTSSYPVAELFLPLMGPDGISYGGYRCSGEANEFAYSTASYLLTQNCGPRPAPEVGSLFITHMMAWARDVGGVCDARGAASEAAQ